MFLRNVAKLTLHGAYNTRPIASNIKIRPFGTSLNDVYAQKLQHHLLDNDFDSAVTLYKSKNQRIPRGLQNVMSLIERLSEKDDASNVQRSTIAFFLKRQRQLAPALLQAYTDLGIIPPAAAFREIVLSLIHSNNMEGTIAALRYAIGNQIMISADVFHQCFLLGDELEWDPQPFVELFLESCEARLIEQLNYPALGSAVVSACLRHSLVDEAIACAAKLPRDSIQSHKTNRILNIFQQLKTDPRTSIDVRRRVERSLLSFYFHEDDTAANELFTCLRNQPNTLTPHLIKDIIMAMYRNGDIESAIEVLDYAYSNKFVVSALVYTVGLKDYPCMELAERLLRAARGNLVDPTVASLCVGMRVALDNQSVSVALDLYEILGEKKLICTQKRLNAVMKYLELCPDDVELHELLVQFILHLNHSAGIPLFHLLVAKDLSIDGSLLQDMLHIVDSEVDAVHLLQYALEKKMVLSGASITTALSRCPRSNGVAGAVLEILGAQLTSPGMSLFRRLARAAEGSTQLVVKCMEVTEAHAKQDQNDEGR